MKQKNLQLTLASVTEPFDSKRALDAIRSGATQMQTCIASLVDVLEEPLRGKFLEVKNQINTMLAGLPASDMVPAASASNDILQQLLGVLATAQMMMSNLTDTAKNARTELQSTRASLPEEVKKEITAKITSGELIPKEQLDTKISDATTAAVTKAREEFNAQTKLVTERKQQLTIAKLVLPGDDILAKKDEEFAPLKAAAEKRAVELKAFGLPEDRILTLCWQADEKSYADAIALMKSVTKQTTANGFIKRDGKPEPTTMKKLGMF